MIISINVKAFFMGNHDKSLKTLAVYSFSYEKSTIFIIRSNAPCSVYVPFNKIVISPLPFNVSTGGVVSIRLSVGFPRSVH
jgi:hypothetical protein